MDILGLVTLREELFADAAAVRAASQAASEHMSQGTHGRLEAAAYEIARAYNIIEQMCQRVAAGFENNVPRNGGWHDHLLRRMTLEIPEIRPAFVPEQLRKDLDEVRRFRHVVHHAYDVTLREDRINELLEMMGRVAVALPGTITRFAQRVAAMNGWTLPGD